MPFGFSIAIEFSHCQWYAAGKNATSLLALRQSHPPISILLFCPLVLTLPLRFEASPPAGLSGEPPEGAGSNSAWR